MDTALSVVDNTNVISVVTVPNYCEKEQEVHNYTERSM